MRPMKPKDRHDYHGRFADYATEGKHQTRRDTVIEIYRQTTGRQQLPEDRQYWSLTGLPVDDRNEELWQLLQSGLIKESQFHGVNEDWRVIRHNSLLYPAAHWHLGVWVDVLFSTEFNPALVYYDTINAIGSRLPRTNLIKTMEICPHDCILIANWVLADAYRIVADQEEELRRFKEALIAETPPSERRLWDWDYCSAYVYKSDVGAGRTTMASVRMRKP